VQLGFGGDISVSMMMITSRELEVYGSFRFHDEFAMGVHLMQKGLVDVAPLITHRFSMAQAVKAFETASDRGTAMKVHLDFNEYQAGVQAEGRRGRNYNLVQNQKNEDMEVKP